MSRTGILRILDLEIECFIGILPLERRLEQTIYLTAEIETDFEVAHAKDGRITHGLDYASLAEFMSKKIKDGHFGLLEEMLISVGEDCLKEHPSIRRIHLTVSKPSAIPMAKSVEAEIRLHRR